MAEVASNKPQCRRADRRSASSTTDGTGEERDGLSPSISGADDKKSESRMSRIARRAHEICEARGGEHGKPLEDWLQAERDIDSELTGERGADGQ